MFAVVGRAWSGDQAPKRSFSVVSLPQSAIAAAAVNTAPASTRGLIFHSPFPLSLSLPLQRRSASAPTASALRVARLAAPSAGLSASIAIQPSALQAAAHSAVVAAAKSAEGNTSLEETGVIGRLDFDGESDAAQPDEPVSPAPQEPPQKSRFRLLRAGAARCGLAASLIATNVAAYAAVPPDQIVSWSFNPQASKEAIISLSASGIAHGLLTAVTMMFMHPHFAHIASNMVGLAIVAPFVQRRYGFKRALLIFIGGGLAANAGSVVVAQDFDGSSVAGASGAIFSLMGAFLAGQRHMGPQGLTHLLVLTSIAGQLWELCAHGPVSADATATFVHVAGAVFGAVLAGLFILRDRHRAGPAS